MITQRFQVAPLVVGALAAGLCFGQSTTPAAREPATGDARPELSAVEKQVVTETNAFRRQESRGELKVNPELSKAARYFADFMAKTDKFSHTADGQEPWDRAKKYGYDYCLVEENIAYEFNPEAF